MRIPILACLLLSGMFSATGAAEGGSLDFFRGPKGDGVAGGKLELPLQLKWEKKHGKHGFGGSFAVAKSTLYIGDSAGTLHAVNAADGSTRWTQGLGSGAAGAPVIVGEQVIIGTVHGEVLSLDRASGTKHWQASVQGELVGGVNVVRPPEGEPIIVLGSHDNSIYGFSSADGKLLWSVPTDDLINGIPGVSGVRCVAGGCDEVLHVIDASTGQKIAGYSMPAFLPSSTTVVGEVAYAPYGNPSEAMTYAAVDLNTGKTLWSFKGDSSFKNLAAVSDKHVVFGDGAAFVHALDRATGKKLWSYETGDEIYSAPVIVDGKVVIGSDDGVLYVLDLHATDPAGKKLWSYEIGPALSISPVVVDGVVYVGDSNGTIYAFASAGR